MQRHHHLLVLLGAVALGAGLVFFGSRPAGIQNGLPDGEPAPGPAIQETGSPMTQRLANLADGMDPLANPYINDARADLFQQELARMGVSTDAMPVWTRYAEELLLAGRSVEAVQQLERIRSLVRQNPKAFHPAFAFLLREHLALAYLRVGEQENCLERHNPDACLLPIRGGGFHTITRGSRAALRLYTEILTEQPDDLGARWLLNLAAMTLGEYPDGVPQQWRIPPAAFEAEYDLPRFPDVAMQAGVAQVGLSGGAIMEDFDGDGRLDLMASSWGVRDQLRLFVNRGDGTFADRTHGAGLSGQIGGLNLTHGDYDNDGDADVLVLRGAWLGEMGRMPNSLLRNNGDGTFTDVTEAAGLLTLHPTQTAAWGDYDNDGLLDLYIGNETGDRTVWFAGKDEGQADAPAPAVHPCQLFHNNGDGTFTDVAGEAGVAHEGFVKGVAWGDYNNDGRIDLYLSRLGAANVLYRNDGSADGAWTFTDVSAESGADGPLFSFPTWFFDYDNDGWLDLFAGGYASGGPHDIAALYLGREHGAEPSRVLHNNGDGTFTDVTSDTGAGRAILVMGANYGDLDNDGWLDWYAGNGAPNYAMLLPNRMFRNDGGRRFQDVTTSGGFGNVQKGHGVAFGDIDNDGDQDIYTTVGGAYSGDVYANSLFLNPGSGAHWLTVRLEGVQTNRRGVGARITVNVETPAGSRAIHRVVGTGGSFGSSSLQQEIGLGDATGIISLDVFWPGSGTTQRFTGVDMDQCILLREGDTTVTPQTLEPQINADTRR